MSVQPDHTYAFAPSPCGGLHLILNGAEVVLRSSGALWIETGRMLVAADLHLEKGSAYAARGQLLPPYDTRETLRRLAVEIALTRPRTVVLLGDTFHDRQAEARLAPEDAQRLRLIAGLAALVWVTGNHDADGPQNLPGEVVCEMDASPLVFRHEPTAGVSPGEVAGHLHPCARVTASRGSVRRRCFVTDGRRLVVPAFGAFAGGLSVRDPAFHGLFERPPLCGALGGDRVRAVGWRSVVGD